MSREFNFARFCVDPAAPCCKAENKANEIFEENVRLRARAKAAESQLAAERAEKAKYTHDAQLWRDATAQQGARGENYKELYEKWRGIANILKEALSRYQFCICGFSDYWGKYYSECPECGRDSAHTEECELLAALEAYEQAKAEEGGEGGGEQVL